MRRSSTASCHRWGFFTRFTRLLFFILYVGIWRRIAFDLVINRWWCLDYGPSGFEKLIEFQLFESGRLGRDFWWRDHRTGWHDWFFMFLFFCLLLRLLLLGVRFVDSRYTSSRDVLLWMFIFVVDDRILSATIFVGDERVILSRLLIGYGQTTLDVDWTTFLSGFPSTNVAHDVGAIGSLDRVSCSGGGQVRGPEERSDRSAREWTPSRLTLPHLDRFLWRRSEFLSRVSPRLSLRCSTDAAWARVWNGEILHPATPNAHALSFHCEASLLAVWHQQWSLA